MSRRSRIIGFGSAALLVVAGGVCTAVLSSGLAQDLTLGVMGLGIVLAVSLVFLEVGYSEDRERAREEAARKTADGVAASPPEQAHSRQPLARPPRPRLERIRGRPRRLR